MSAETISHEQALVAWLCILRIQFAAENPFYLPGLVGDELERRGWLRRCGGPDWDGHSPVQITAAGHAACDMADPELGITLEFSAESDGA